MIKTDGFEAAREAKREEIRALVRCVDTAANATRIDNELGDWGTVFNLAGALRTACRELQAIGTGDL